MSDVQLVIYAVVIVLWLSYLPVAIIQLKGWVRNRKIYFNSNLTRVHNDPFIIFQIMTRSAKSSDVVKRGIESIHASCKKISYTDYSICVVTEDPRDTTYVSGARVLVVPKGYKTRNGAIRKARALQYAVERRRIDERGSEVKARDRWIFHLDEESVVTTQTLLSLLAFIRDGRGLIAEGPIAYPLKIRQSNRLTFLAESVRPFQCYDCVSHMTHPPPMYMHGSNLFVRADVEDKVGWDHGTSVAEDQLFGVKVHERYGNIFGWHGGMLLEQPPLNLLDHFKQRRRWVIGTLQNLKYLPKKLKARIYLRAATYWLGFLSAMASIAMYVYYFSPYVILFFSRLLGINYKLPQLASLPIATPQSVSHTIQGGHFILTLESLYTISFWQSVISTVFGACLLLALGIWITSYQVGLRQNLKFASDLSLPRKAFFHLQQLVLCPIIGIVETFPAFYAVLEFHLFGHNIKDFEVITK
ncbi:MAG TPA: glycosyltransferase family 2 protein [Nitrososphaerales archaeon]|nr:glycosyltransferase family 2 protein [Nitrososphaerales archaeon]